MAWQLEIHIIDIGQGDSSLIIASNPTTNQQRSMLIDGGEAGCAQTVHNVVAAQGLAAVDHILVTHYDTDHSVGIVSLLKADNLYKICDTIAQLAVAEAQMGQNRTDQIAGATGAACAAALGAYGAFSGDARNVGTAIRLAQLPQGTDAQATQAGIAQAENYMLSQGQVNPNLIPTSTKWRAVARVAGIAAANAILNGQNVLTETRNAIFDDLKKSVDVSQQFQTGGIYHNTQIIDIGNTAHTTPQYNQALAGRIYYNGTGTPVLAPGINRPRLSAPVLGAEILWNSGPAAMAAPANAPAIFVVACLNAIWHSNVTINSGSADNDEGIALILRFNQFFYYSGGDLATVGEDAIATAVMNNGLPDPQAPPNLFATPHRVACFKCGHHGSNKSTSQTFLNRIRAKGTFISCHWAVFGDGEKFPVQSMVDRLHNDANIQYFYLTNCKYVTNHIPASQANPQLVVNNKSRVAGDNANNNRAAGRQRGDISISIDEAESTSPHTAGPLLVGQVLRQYHVSYYDDDNAVQNIRSEATVF